MLTLLPNHVALDLRVLNLNPDLLIDSLPVLVLDLLHLSLHVLVLESELIQLLSQSHYLRVIVCCTGD